jgi:hypothetical protein
MPAFCKTEQEALLTLETETSKKIVEILTAAKQREIKLLESRCSPDAHVATHMALFTSRVTAYAAQFDASILPGPPAAAAAARTRTFARFPTAAAITAHEQHLRAIVLACVERHAFDAVAAEDQRVAAVAADRAALESVLEGAHTGATIAKVARRETSRMIQPLVNTFRSLKDKGIIPPDRPPAASAAASAAAAADDTAMQTDGGDDDEFDFTTEGGYIVNDPDPDSHLRSRPPVIEWAPEFIDVFAALDAERKARSKMRKENRKRRYEPGMPDFECEPWYYESSSSPRERARRARDPKSRSESSSRSHSMHTTPSSSRRSSNSRGGPPARF